MPSNDGAVEALSTPFAPAVPVGGGSFVSPDKVWSEVFIKSSGWWLRLRRHKTFVVTLWIAH
jgi:hypothetical protein